MDVGINQVAQELDVTKLVFPNGPLIGLKSWDIRWADIMGRVSPLRLMNVSQTGEGGFSEDVVLLQAKFISVAMELWMV